MLTPAGKKNSPTIKNKDDLELLRCRSSGMELALVQGRRRRRPRLPASRLLRSVSRLDLQLLDREIVVGVDARVRGDPHRPLADLPRRQPGGVEQRARRRERVGGAAADRQDAVVGLQDVAAPRDRERDLGVGDDHDRVEPAEVLVGPVKFFFFFFIVWVWGCS